MFLRIFMLILAVGSVGYLYAQEEPGSNGGTESAPAEPAEKKPDAATSTTDKIIEVISPLEKKAEKELTKIAKQVDEDPRAKTASAGILQPIYAVAKTLAFPAFHWVAFSLMAAGVVSYGLQIALGKLVVLMRMGFSLKEIASDAVGLAISVVGLVLTTQAAAENSTFTQSPALVISATGVGAIVGFILYLWGQSQELQAADGRSRAATVRK